MKKIPILLIVVLVPNLFLFFLMGNQTDETNLSLDHVLLFAFILSIISVVLFAAATLVNKNVYSSSIITAVFWVSFWLYSYIEETFIFMLTFVLVATTVIKINALLKYRSQKVDPLFDKQEVINKKSHFKIRVIPLILISLVALAVFTNLTIVRAVLVHVVPHRNLLFLALFMISCVLSSLVVGKSFERKLSNKSEIFKYASIILSILVGYNLFLSVNYLQSFRTTQFASADGFNFKTEFNVENNTPSPNIYWLHLDGMWSLNNVENVFHESQDFFRDELADRGFLINEDANLFGFSTNNTMPILFSPDFYDRYHHYFTTETVNRFTRGDIGIANMASSTSSQISRIGLSFERDLYPNQELFEALRQGGYRIVVIPETRSWRSYAMNFDAFYRWNISGIWNNALRMDTSRISLGVQLEDLLYLLSGTPIGLFQDIIGGLLNGMSFIQVELVDVSNFEFIDEHKQRIPAWFDRDDISLSNMINAYTALLSAMSGAGSQFIYLEFNTTHASYWAHDVTDDLPWYNPNFFGNYMCRHQLIQFQILSTLDIILKNDPTAVIVLQSDHGIHVYMDKMSDWGASDELIFNLMTGHFSAVRIPQEYGGLDYPLDPRNISRVLVNRFVGQNYELRTDAQDFDILNYWRR